MTEVLRWYFRSLAAGLLVLPAMLLAGAVGLRLGKYIGSVFGFGEEITDYIVAGSFFLILTIIGLTYERWWQWRFFRSVQRQEVRPLRDIVTEVVSPHWIARINSWVILCALGGAAVGAVIVLSKRETFDECMVREMRSQARVMYSHVHALCSSRQP